MEENTEQIKFTETVAALKDVDHPFPARLLRGFSDLSPKDLKEFLNTWPEIPLQRKRSVLEDLEELTELDTLVCFDEIAKVLLDDPDPVVRVIAIRLLWECEDHHIVLAIIEMMLSDTDEAVRSTAASLLGRFVYLGELDEIPDSAKIAAVSNLLEVAGGDDLPSVRLRALESLGYSGNNKVASLIKHAYESSETLWVASALCAMGRSADEQWNDYVLEKLDSGDEEIQFEAVRAAGELEIAASLEQLFALVEEGDHDSEVRLAAIWSLSQIGGPEVKDKLKELLEESESDEETEWIEKALENLDLGGDAGNMDFFNFKPQEDDESDDFDEFEEDEVENEGDYDRLDDYDEDDDEDDED